MGKDIKTKQNMAWAALFPQTFRSFCQAFQQRINRVFFEWGSSLLASFTHGAVAAETEFATGSSFHETFLLLTRAIK